MRRGMDRLAIRDADTRLAQLLESWRAKPIRWSED